MSRSVGSTGRNPFSLSLLTPGPLGCRDAADPNSSLGLGDTPGTLGRNDCADPESKLPYDLGVRPLHTTLSGDPDLRFWDYDPNRLLDDERLNPDFVEQAHRGLSIARSFGLRPRVHEAYRSIEESDKKHSKWKKTGKGKAAPGWQSVHNYGLAMDVWLYDRQGRYISNNTKGWYPLYKVLAKACSTFLWGEPFDDADHFEYHPNWPKPAKGEFLLPVRIWAMEVAAQTRKFVNLDAFSAEAKIGAGTNQNDFIPESDLQWLPYFWWAAGAANREAPPNSYLASNRPPIQV